MNNMMIPTAEDAYNSVMNLEFKIKKFVVDEDGIVKIIRETPEDILGNPEYSNDLNVVFGWIEKRTELKCRGRASDEEITTIIGRVYDASLRGQTVPSFRYGRKSLGPGRWVKYVDCIIERRGIADYYKQFGVKTPIKKGQEHNFRPEDIHKDSDGRSYYYKKTTKGKTISDNDSNLEDVNNNLESRIMSSEAAMDLLKVILLSNGKMYTKFEFFHAITEKIHLKNRTQMISPFVDETVFVNKTNDEVVDHIKERILIVGSEINMTADDIQEVLTTIDNVYNGYKLKDKDLSKKSFEVIKRNTLKSAFSRYSKKVVSGILNYYYNKDEPKMMIGYNI